jgi:hypothetical protein
MPSINIFGSFGNTGPKRLNVSDANGKVPTFDRGSECEVTLSAFDVGDMTHVVVALDGTGLLSSWFLDELEVEHLGTGQLLRFNVARSVSVDHKTTRCYGFVVVFPDPACMLCSDDAHATDTALSKSSVKQGMSSRLLPCAGGWMTSGLAAACSTSCGLILGTSSSKPAAHARGNWCCTQVTRVSKVLLAAED